MPGNHEPGHTRRRILRAGLVVAGGAVTAGRAQAAENVPAENQAREQPAGAKLTLAAVHYQPTPHDWEKCLYCSFFKAPSTCGIVAGTVSKNGWCDHFTLLHE
jgi:hypothetical protein